MLRPKTVLDLGCYTGMSSLVMGATMKEIYPNCKNLALITCDKSDQFLQIAKKSWLEAKIDSMVEFKKIDARQLLEEVSEQVVLVHKVDLIFVDCDKKKYIDYFDLSLPLLKRGGCMVFDNTLWKGKVALEVGGEKDERQKDAISAFNEYLVGQKSVHTVVLPMADGVSICVKK